MALIELIERKIEKPRTPINKGNHQYIIHYASLKNGFTYVERRHIDNQNKNYLVFIIDGGQLYLFPKLDFWALIINEGQNFIHYRKDPNLIRYLYHLKPNNKMVLHYCNGNIDREIDITRFQKSVIQISNENWI